MFSYIFEKTVNSERLSMEIINQGLINLYQIDTVGGEVFIFFSTELTSEEQITLDTIVSNHILQTTREIVEKRIKEAISFGNSLIFSIATENVLMGITQANKTKEVADYCKNVQAYLQTGSLYAALSELDTLIAAGAPTELSPFITDVRLSTTRSKIATFLGL